MALTVVLRSCDTCDFSLENSARIANSGNKLLAQKPAEVSSVGGGGKKKRNLLYRNRKEISQKKPRKIRIRQRPDNK